MHLHMAERLVRRLEAEPLCQPLLWLLESHWPAFYLGSVAPDFQAICRVPRETTHFYPIPPERGDEAAFARMLAQYDHLTAVASLPPDQAVFVAAYGAHLLYDLIWDGAILTPHFRLAEWDDVRERFMGYNTLLTYLDRQVLPALPETAGTTLSTAVVYESLLPFATAEALANWQEMLVAQLLPGASIRTVEIYAARMGVSEAQFVAQLEDEAWMAQKVFQHVSLEQVAEAMDTAMVKSVRLLSQYLAPLLPSA
jgi:hypothetical protein